jgi:Xaa-Pro dipeptidase
MGARDIDAMLLFSPESHFWLTGYDTFGFCFFQCLVFRRDGTMALLTRSADLRQARHTSTIEDVRVWVDGDASPAAQLRAMLADLGLSGARLGIETDTHGLTHRNGKAVEAALGGFVELVEASDLLPRLRVVKSPAEVAYARRAAALADEAYEAALDAIGPGADEATVLARLQGTVLAGGGDYPGNEFIVGSGRDALLVRSKSGRRTLDADDQITLEFAGAYRRYHAALMRTVVVGRPRRRHFELHEAAVEALAAVEDAMRPGSTFADVFEAHRAVMDRRGLAPHRLNACGYSLGARFTPSWMDWPMFHAGNTAPVLPNMTLFAHMILLDSDDGTAMTLGRTYLTTGGRPEPLSRLSLDLPRR